MNRPTSLCTECGMSVHVGEYHPYAACLMFKGCKDSATVRANLSAIRENVVVVDLNEIIEDFKAASSDTGFQDPHPIFLMAQELDNYRHINAEPIGHITAEGEAVLDRKVVGGYLYWGYAPK